MRAQQADRVWRIGFVGIGPRTPAIDYFLVGFRRGLGELGYVEGRDVLIEYRWPAAGHDDPLLHLSEELAGFRLDVLVVCGEVALLMVRRMQAPPTTVFVLYNEPRMWTLVVSFERPGGWWTGLTTTAPDRVIE
jgi:putative tryptophan/tyrosine transport system substrate-binding protein